MPRLVLSKGRSPDARPGSSSSRPGFKMFDLGFGVWGIGLRVRCPTDS